MKEPREHGREAPIVISPLRLGRLVIGLVHQLRAGRRQRSRP